MDVLPSLDYLYSLRSPARRENLEHMRVALARIGNPHEHLRAIHIAGTNGKGTVARLLYGLFRAEGQRVGLFTSPHILRFNERIVVDDCEIPDHYVVAFIETHKPLFDELGLSFFEATTLLAFDYFSHEGCEVVVLETGLGGRLDATNVVDPEVAIITDIALDHQQYLGTTLAQIAAEKAGICKSGRPTVFGVSSSEARRVVSLAAGKDGIDAIAETEIVWHREAYNGHHLRISMGDCALGEHFFPIPGLHQVHNVRIAMRAMHVLGKIDEQALATTLSTFKNPGRLEYVWRESQMLLDVAHNEQGLAALVQHLLRFHAAERCAVVIGLSADKESRGIFEALRPLGERAQIIWTRAGHYRAADAEELRQGAGFGLCSADVAEGLRIARAQVGAAGLVVVCGSFFVVADAYNPR